MTPREVITDRLIPDGNAGRLFTLDRMIQMAVTEPESPAFRHLVAIMLGGIDPGRADAWLRLHWVLAPDPYGLDQQVKWPAVCLWEIETSAPRRFLGKCTDIAALMAAIGLASGCHVRYVVIAQLPDQILDHVWCEWADAHVPGGWYAFDPIMPGVRDGLPWQSWTKRIEIALPEGTMSETAGQF